MAPPADRPIWPLAIVTAVALVGGLMLLFGDREEQPEPTDAPTVQPRAESVERSPVVDTSRRANPSGFRPGADGRSQPAEADDPEAEEPREEAPEEREPHPLAAMIDSGTPMTVSAREQRRMSELDPADPAYDPLVDAQQMFAPFEDTLLAAGELTPAVWKAALEEHQERNMGVMHRAEFLRESGQPEAGGDLMLEWSRLYGHYQGRAYGRNPPPLQE